MAKLTKREIDAAKPGAKDFIIWDGELRGFGCRIFSSGRKSYLVQYRFKGRTRRMTIGAHGLFTPDQARTEAQRLLLDAKMGKDPSQERQNATQAPTMNELADEYLERHARPFKKPRGVANDEWLLDRYVRPRMGKRRVADVTHAEVDRQHASLKDKPVLANRLHSLLSKMFSLAERWDMREPGTSPTRGVERYPEKSRERFLSSAEWAKLGEAFREDEREKPSRASAINALRLMAFTGARRGEIEQLTWEEVDLECGALELIDSKTGPKRVMLNGPALEILNAVDQSSSLVFSRPSRSLEPLNLSATWIRVRRRAGLDGLRMHDLRHSHASAGVNAGLGLAILSKLLGHSSTAMTEKYAHLHDDPLREASELIGGKIAADLGGQPKAEVVPIGRGDG